MSANNYQVKPNILAPAIPDNLYNEAIRLFSIPSTTYNEKSMAMYICSQLDYMKIKYSIDDYGNIIAVKGKSNLYPCFVSHLDTVHLYQNGFKLLYQKEKDRTYLFACDNNKKSVGIGGDDKCGIFVCLYLLKRIDNIKVVFFSQEETGGIGSSNINLNIFDDCKFICSVDRWNGHDFIDKYNGMSTISAKMKKHISNLLKKYDYSSNSGLFTDCFNVMERGVNLSCFNLSCGYYSHHSSNEYVDLNELYNACLLCAEIAILPDKYEHKFKTKKYSVGKWDEWDKICANKLTLDKYDYKFPDYGDKDFNDNVPTCDNCGLELFWYEHKYCSSCVSYMKEDDDFYELLKDNRY